MSAAGRVSLLDGDSTGASQVQRHIRGAVLGIDALTICSCAFYCCAEQAGPSCFSFGVGVVISSSITS